MVRGCVRLGKFLAGNANFVSLKSVGPKSAPIIEKHILFSRFRSITPKPQTKYQLSYQTAALTPQPHILHLGYVACATTES